MNLLLTLHSPDHRILTAPCINASRIRKQPEMTTVFLTEKKCFVCGKKNRCPHSATGFIMIGPRDLDGRPSHSQRSSIYMSMQRCIFCGFTAADITVGYSEDLKTVTLKEYQDQLTCPEYPETANTYLCKALLYEKNGKFNEGGWASIYAAWVCDDNNFSDAAVLCRGRALKLFSKARIENQRFAENSEEEDLLIVDLLRRRREFSAAREICAREVTMPHGERTLDIYTLQLKLISAQNAACHRDSEAVENDD